MTQDSSHYGTNNPDKLQEIREKKKNIATIRIQTLAVVHISCAE